jgi:hypothetical protein
LPALGGIEGLTIISDHDPTGAGRRAAEACAARWSEAGADVELLEPFREGDDANDVLRGLDGAR